jgi:NADP-dependent 3-hydroxy acid dehydrogenase YdfG
MATSPFLLILGAGPGVGTSVAREFGRRGYAVGLVARSADRLETLAAELRSEGIDATTAAADLTEEGALAGAVQTLAAGAGRVDVLHFNPSRFREAGPLELTPAELLEDVALGAASLLTAVRVARPFLGSGARIVATGSRAADRPWHRAASLGVQKAALRNLVASLDAALSADGIRAVNVQVNGVLAREGPFSPAAVAGAIADAVDRPDDVWTVQVGVDG